MFAVTGITNKGKTSACQADMKTIQTAEEAYSANTGAYTTLQTDLVNAGLMHAVTVNPFTIALANVGSPAIASYTIPGTGPNCTGTNG